jgi:hypothetical protein
MSGSKLKILVDLQDGANPADIVNTLTKDEGLAGERGKSCALVASNLIGAWKICIAALAGKGEAASGITMDLLDPNALDTFGGGDETTATKCASSASGILSEIFKEDTLARLLANYARGNDASTTSDSDAAVSAFNDAYKGLTAALQKVKDEPAATATATAAAAADEPAAP